VEGQSVDDMAYTSEVVGFIATSCVKEEAETGKMAGEGFCCDPDAVWKSGDLGYFRRIAVLGIEGC